MKDGLLLCLTLSAMTLADPSIDSTSSLFPSLLIELENIADAVSRYRQPNEIPLGRKSGIGKICDMEKRHGTVRVEITTVCPTYATCYRCGPVK